MSMHMPGPMTQNPSGYRGDLRPAANYPAPYRGSSGGMSILPLLGLGALGLIVLGGVYFAPDVIRYMKIRNM